MLGFGVIWWSFATVVTPLAAKLGLPCLLLVRACMGIGEVIMLFIDIYVCVKCFKCGSYFFI